MFSFLMWALGIACAVWVIYDVWTVNRSASPLAKIVWSVAAVAFSIITAGAYFFLEKRKD